jgi:transcriptional regulator with XRE-family HTH domain
MNIGQMIKTKRKEKGLTQGQVAKKIGVSTNTISKYERNIIANMGREKVIGLSRLLDIPTIAFIEAIDELETKNTKTEQITPKEFQYEVKELLDKTTSLTEQEKELFNNYLELICSNKE